jgi:sugar lactone lactonase YvrE
MTGNIFEIIQYNSDLGQTARQQVEGYLASKWGLQANLPTNHPYKSSTPDVTNARGTRRPVGLPPRSNIAFPRLKIIASIDTPSATLSSLTSTGATVTWSEISGAISYTVTIYYNSSASVTTSNLQVAQSPYTLATSGSTFTFTATDTTYYAATVTAINATAQATSSISSPVLYTAPPGQATTNTPTNTGTTLNMSWSAASGSVTAYTVYVLAGGSLAPSGTLSLGNVTSTTFSPMVSGTVYSFYVVATGPGGSGTQSTTSSTVTYTAVPVAPTSITLASLTATGATVTWSGGSGATYFTCQIYSSASSNMSSSSIISPQTPDSSTSITTPQVFTFSVTAGLYYGAIITAVNAGGSTSSAMSTGVLYSVAEPPVAPTTVTLASLTGSGATVTWSGGSGATYYTCQIYSSAASNMSSPTTISQSPSSSSSVSSGQVFSFSVEDSLYYGAIVTTVNASGSAASSMSTGVQFVGTYSGLGPVTTLATGFGNLYNLAIDSAENIYLADYGGHKVWYIPSGGSPSIFAGSTSGYVDGAAGSAKFNGPSGVAVSSDGATVYVTDYGSSKIRKINGGTVTTLAGGTHGAWVDGASNVARFFYPSGIAIDRTETVLFIGDKLTHRIRVVTIATGAVTTLAGGASSSVGGSGAYADGTGSNASFNSPLGVCVGLDNSVYVADSANHRIRKVTYPEGVVTTVAGSGVGGFSNALGTAARFLYPYGLAMDSYGILYVADKDNKRIRQITASGNVTTFAGTGTNTNVDNANRLLATFVQPTGVVVNSSRTSLYVTQTVTPAVRKITLS